MNRKSIIAIIVAVACVLLIAAFAMYNNGIFQNMFADEDARQDGPGETQNQPSETRDSVIGSGSVEIETRETRSLIICSDKCGDGICQLEPEETCENLNCICQENTQECPADCR